jgi:hypothetical protein
MQAASWRCLVKRCFRCHRENAEVQDLVPKGADLGVLAVVRGSQLRPEALLARRGRDDDDGVCVTLWLHPLGRSAFATSYTVAFFSI